MAAISNTSIASKSGVSKQLEGANTVETLVLTIKLRGHLFLRPSACICS